MDFFNAAEVDAILRAWDTTGGMVAAVQQGADGVWTERLHVFGTRNVAGDPVTADTRFFIASNSKLFCALAADMALRDAGFAAGVATRIRDVVPGYRLQDPVAAAEATFADALGHRTGLPRLDHYMTRSVCTLDDMLASLAEMRPSLPFRTGTQYHNPHYSFVALVVEVLAGCSYGDFVDRRILQPLGMASTTVSADACLQSPNHADGFIQLDEPSKTTPGRVVMLPCGMDDQNAALLGSGRMSSTATDMARWLKALLQGMADDGPGAASQDAEKPVLRRAALARCRTGTNRFYEYARDYPELGPSVYGLGLSEQAYRGHTLVEHVGSLAGWMSRLTLVPTQRMGFYVCVNNYPWGEMAAEEVKYALLDRLLAPVSRGPAVNWHARFVSEKQKTLDEAAAKYAAPYAPSSGAVARIPSKTVAGVYRAPGFITWTLQPEHILDGPPEDGLSDVLPLPFVWSPRVQPLAWPTAGKGLPKGAHSYMMCWQFAFPDGMTEPVADRYGQPMDMELDVQKSHGQVKVLGFGLRGIWGAGKDVPSPEGTTVRARAEVYFDKIE